MCRGINSVSVRGARAAALLFGQVEDPFASRALDLVAFEIRRDFEFQAADASQECEAVDHAHDVADLARLFLAAYFLLGLFAGLAQSNILFCQGAGGNYCFVMSYIAKGVGVVLEGCAVGHIA